MGFPTSQSSGLLGVTAGTLLYPGRNTINSVSVAPGATLTILDNATGAASGNVALQVVNASTSTIVWDFTHACRVTEGLTYVIAGAGGNIIYFGAA